MPKKSSYQKLKEQNKKLLSDIQALVMRNSYIETAKIEAMYRLKFEFAEVVWSGTLTKIKQS